MDEARVLADRVAVLCRGAIVALGSPDSLIGDRGVRIRFAAVAGDDPATIAGLTGGTASLADGLLSVEVRDPTRALHALTGWALATDRTLHALEVVRPSLEDVYLELTGEVVA